MTTTRKWTQSSLLWVTKISIQYMFNFRAVSLRIQWAQHDDYNISLSHRTGSDHRLLTMETLPLYIKKTLFCLTLILYFTNLVSSQNYYVDPLDDTRSALLSYSSTPSKPGGICKTSCVQSSRFLGLVSVIALSLSNLNSTLECFPFVLKPVIWIFTYLEQPATKFYKSFSLDL